MQTLVNSAPHCFVGLAAFKRVATLTSHLGCALGNASSSMLFLLTARGCAFSTMTSIKRSYRSSISTNKVACHLGDVLTVLEHKGQVHPGSHLLTASHRSWSHRVSSLITHKCVSFGSPLRLELWIVSPSKRLCLHCYPKFSLSVRVIELAWCLSGLASYLYTFD